MTRASWITLLATVVLSRFAGAAEWSQFRGPNSSGIGDGKPPVEFGPSQNVLWKTDVGSGLSSPIIAKGRIFLTEFDRPTKQLATLCEGHGGTIYQWTLGFNCYPHQIALKKGYQAMFDFLYSESEPETRLLVNCVLARRADAEAIAREHPEIVPELQDVDRELVAKYCWETNTNYDAVKLMLDLGFPVAHPERSHGYTPLHNAAWAGSGDLVELLISRGHPVDTRDPAYDATPLGYALHDCRVEKRHPDGEFARVVKALAEAGSPMEDVKYPTGDAAVDEVLRAYI